MVLSFQACDDSKTDEMVDEKPNLSLYGEEEIDFTFAGSGDAGTEQDLTYTYIYMADVEFNTQTGLPEGSNFVALFFAHTTDALAAKNFTSIEDSRESSAEMVFEGAKFTYDYDPNTEGPSAITAETGTINLINYDEANGTVELEYEFTFPNGKTLKGYYKGELNDLGEVG